VSWSEFHVAYREGVGMTLVRGRRELSWLSGEIEGYASGLATTGQYADGGPLVLQVANGRRIVGWLRGLAVEEVGRHGVWEAWGVVGEAADDPWYWPRYWKELQAAREAAAAKRLVDGMNEGGSTDGPPDPPLALTGILRAFELETQQPYVLVLSEPGDLALLPWVWLLGPVDPRQATIGPPRPQPHAARPFSYEAVWVDEVAAYGGGVGPAARSLPSLARLIRTAQDHPSGLAQALHQHYRRADGGPPNARKPAAVAAVSAAAPAVHPIGDGKGKDGKKDGKEKDGKGKAGGEGRPAAPRFSVARDRAESPQRLWTIAIVSMLGASLLLSVAVLALLLDLWSRRPPPAATPATDTVSAAVHQPEPSPTPTTAVAADTCSGEFELPDSQRQLARDLLTARSQRLRLSPRLAEVASRVAAAAQPTWSESDRSRFVVASQQLQLQEARCLEPGSIDGLSGDATNLALQRCGVVADRSESNHLRWLCQWLRAY
jgi:hypothetical protein